MGWVAAVWNFCHFVYAVFFHAGDAPTGLLVVLEGKVRVVRQSGERAQVVHVEGLGGRWAKCRCSPEAGGEGSGSAADAQKSKAQIIPNPAVPAADGTGPRKKRSRRLPGR